MGAVKHVPEEIFWLPSFCSEWGFCLEMFELVQQFVSFWGGRST